MSKVIRVLLLLIAILLPCIGCVSGNAAQGYVIAQYDLAKKWEKKDKPQEAFYWMSQAANGMYPRAMGELAIYYTIGYGVTPNMDNAIKWIFKYATISPQESLGILETVKHMFDKSTREGRIRILLFLKDLLIIGRGQHDESVHQGRGQHNESVHQMAIANEILREMSCIQEDSLSRANSHIVQKMDEFYNDMTSTFKDVFDEAFYMKAEEIMNQVHGKHTDRTLDQENQ